MAAQGAELFGLSQVALVYIIWAFVAKELSWSLEAIKMRFLVLRLSTEQKEKSSKAKLTNRVSLLDIEPMR